MGSISGKNYMFSHWLCLKNKGKWSNFFSRVNKHPCCTFLLINISWRYALHCIHSIITMHFFPATDSRRKNTFSWWWWCRNQAINSEDDRRKLGMNYNWGEEIRSWYLVLSYCAVLSYDKDVSLSLVFWPNCSVCTFSMTPKIREGICMGLGKQDSVILMDLWILITSVFPWGFCSYQIYSSLQRLKIQKWKRCKKN